MVEITSLWAPILIAAIVVFVVSSVIHMGPFWHRSDFPKLTNEAQFMQVVRPLALAPGDYMVPKPDSMADMKTPEFAEKRNQGPVVLMTVMRNGPMTMGPLLAQWFIYLLVVSLLTGYITGHALERGAPYLRVFQVAGATAFVSYAAALWPLSIWFRRGWSLTFKGTLDGLIYGLFTAGTFGWLWPH
jgi:hypothetical protein